MKTHELVDHKSRPLSDQDSAYQEEPVSVYGCVTDIILVIAFIGVACMFVCEIISIFRSGF